VTADVVLDTQKALAWIANVLNVQGRDITRDDTRNTLSEWDSLGDLLLLSTLEEELGIVVSADEVAAIRSVGEILALMERSNAFRAG
jgi:acyl carrier protein